MKHFVLEILIEFWGATPNPLLVPQYKIHAPFSLPQIMNILLLEHLAPIILIRAVDLSKALATALWKGT